MSPASYPCANRLAPNEYVDSGAADRIGSPLKTQRLTLAEEAYLAYELCNRPPARTGNHDSSH